MRYYGASGIAAPTCARAGVPRTALPRLYLYKMFMITLGAVLPRELVCSRIANGDAASKFIKSLPRHRLDHAPSQSSEWLRIIQMTRGLCFRGSHWCDRYLGNSVPRPLHLLHTGSPLPRLHY